MNLRENDKERDFSHLRECKACNKMFKSLNGLSNHLKQKHKFELQDYIIKYILNNITFKCKCGCNKNVKFYQNHFQNYLSGHISKTDLFDNPWFRNIGKSPKNKINFSEEDVSYILNNFINNHEQIDKLAKKFNCSVKPIKRILDNKITEDQRFIFQKVNNSWRRKNDPIINMKMKEAASKGGSGFSKKHNTSIEVLMKKLLKENNIRDKFIFQDNIKDYEKNTKYSFDFVDKRKKIIIECDGDYWHGNPIFYKELNETQQSNRNRDILKENFCKKNGYKLYRFWEYDFKNNIEKIKNVLLEIKQIYKEG